ncbi:putative TIR domain, P-loop containing nucleoside triphosphate hydrolase [Helianthus annuus]|nr:putative TIR domain, P-loop containing nucleoside triphosphate hydrolase [Helianthus annuus]
MASSSYSSQLCKNYHVFLSFRGEDTRKTFVDYLYSTLEDRLISTYKDDVALPRGESIRPSLFKAIEGSRIAVVIFSEKYADSSWCLDELAHIMKCREERKLIVLPIFYCVDPSEVRKQKGKFEEAFAKHKIENNNKVESWRDALVRATEIAGWEPKNIANGHEMKAINQIVDTIFETLFSLTSLDVEEDLVGMGVRLQQLEAELDIKSPGVRMVGIWGVGGSGKTTLATSLCMRISCHFQGHCIVENIREESAKCGLKALQENILSCLLKTDTRLQSVAQGKHIIRSRLSQSKVLIILDDVDHIDQLDALAGSHDWFGNGSRIIMTTRNKELLISHKEVQVFPVILLSREEAIQLFNKRAYNKNKPVKDYDSLSLSVVSYAAGLPLALKVIGSFLCGKNEEEWRCTLARLKEKPDMEIVDILKISYDGLKPSEKQLFLDITCFFRWESKLHAMEVFEACGYGPGIGIDITALRQKALITIVNGRFIMHDLIQEMGHYIVRHEHPNDPEKHSRVWKCDEIENMHLGDTTMENDKIKAIQYLYPRDGYLSLFCQNVSKMKNLRYLKAVLTTQDKIDKNTEAPSFLSNELCYIEWEGYPRSPFPNSFKPMKLVILKLQYSLQKKLWKGYKHLPNLKVLQLSHMKNLLCTPDYDQLPCLEKLILNKCGRLKKIHPSLGNHKSLEYVSINLCGKLRMVPKIVHMGKLKTLKIHYSYRTVKFPKVESNMESLVELSLKSMEIDTLLSSIGERCANLISVELRHCCIKKTKANFDGLRHLEKFTLNDLSYREDGNLFGISWLNIIKVDRGRYVRPPFVFPQFTHLRKLNVSGCWLTDAAMPSKIGEIFNLEELDLSYNYDVTKLDFCLSQLTRLKVLNLSFCRKLLELPELPSGLIILRAEGCSKLRIVTDFYTPCKCLCDVSFAGVGTINDGDQLLESMLQGKAVENHCMVLILEGLKIAKEFTPPLLKECRYTLELPDNWCNNFSGFLMCVVVKGAWFYDMYQPMISIEQVMSGMDSHNDVVWEGSRNDWGSKTLLLYVSFASLRHTKWWDETRKEVLFYIEKRIFHRYTCHGIGVRLIPKKSGNGPTETSTTQEEQDFSLYTPNIEIRQDSQYAFKFSLKHYG